MKLLTYDTGTGPRCGVLLDNDVVDISALVGDGQLLRDVRALLELGDSPIDRVRDALAKNLAAPRVPLTDVHLRSPILQPPTVRDFIVYEEHASNQGTREPAEVWYRMPVFYFSNPLCIYGPDAEIPYPSASQQFDYELEIGCVIGREGSNVSAADALEYVAGFTLFNDWSARDLQVDEMAFGLGPAKGKDTASSIGPWLVTTDELAPYLKRGRLHLKCQIKVNGDLWLIDGATEDAYYTFGDMVERASLVVALSEKPYAKGTKKPGSWSPATPDTDSKSRTRRRCRNPVSPKTTNTNADCGRDPSCGRRSRRVGGMNGRQIRSGI